jgi:hypothetical protein
MTWASETIWLIVALGVLLAYPLVMRVLAKTAEPLRERLLYTADEALAAPSVSAPAKERIRHVLDDALSARLMIGLFVALPIVVLGKSVRSREREIHEQMNRDGQKHVEAVIMRAVLSGAAANPIFALLVAAEIAILMLVLYPLGKIRDVRRLVQAGVAQADERWLHRA